MTFIRNSLVSLNHYTITILLCNYVCKSISIEVLNVSDLTKSLNNVSKLQNSVPLPKDYVFTANEMSEYIDLYLAGQQNEDIYLNGTQLIQKYGYNVEEHHVTTIDGYILGLYRIRGNGRIVFLMHGLFNSFVDWLTVGPDQSLAYILANQGYDVWMGNARGNTFSRKHNRLSPSDPEFWKFSFDEIGTIDLPTMIDYVLLKTEKKILTYVGYSQGTTALFALCSTKPEYNDKIDFVVALAPAAFLKHTPNPLLQIAAYNYPIIYALGRAIGLNELAPDNDLKKVFSLTFCGNSLLASIVCQNIAFLLVGFSYSQVNYKQLPVIFNHYPAGSSLMQLVHYGQLIKSGEFRKYDHGLLMNLKKYGSTSPPSYPVENIDVPISLFYSQGDWAVSPIDVNKLRSKLKRVVDNYEVPLKSFNHIDFLWAKDVKKLLYDKILMSLKQN